MRHTMSHGHGIMRHDRNSDKGQKTVRKRKLSKSRYLKGINCPKALWLYAYKPELASDTSENQQFVFDMGHVVGSYAHALFEGGVLIEEDHEQLDLAIKKTKKLIDEGANVIFEATVEYNDVLVRADVLERVRPGKNRWNLYEVKSSASVKDVHYPDAAIQKYCFDGAGYPVERVFLTHINSDYVRSGNIEPDKLLVHEELTHELENELRLVHVTVNGLLEMLKSKKCPEIKPGTQCTSPYLCDYYDVCNKMEDYSIYELYRGYRKIPILEDMGISMLKDIPDDFELTGNQRKQVESAKSLEPVIDREELGVLLGQLEYPLYFLDFETARCAVPLFDNTRPFMHIPFQFSLHVQKEPAAQCTNTGFLAQSRQDPRKKLVEQLLENIGTKGSIVVYNKSFEGARLEELAGVFPQHAHALRGLVPRMWDLMKIFTGNVYVDYAFKGSASLKNVLPVLVPGLSYEDLEFQEGDSVSIMATKWFRNELSDQEWENLRAPMLEYCSRDTLGTVEILKALLKAVELWVSDIGKNKFQNILF